MSGSSKNAEGGMARTKTHITIFKNTLGPALKRENIGHAKHTLE